MADFVSRLTLLDLIKEMDLGMCSRSRTCLCVEDIMYWLTVEFQLSQLAIPWIPPVEQKYCSYDLSYPRRPVWTHFNHWEGEGRKLICSVQFSLSVTSNSLRPHGLQHSGIACPSPIPGAYSNRSPSSWWCHPIISSSSVPFSSHLQSFPASGSFQVSQFFASGGQSIGVSASTSVLPMNSQGWLPLGWTGWISLQSKGLSRAFFNSIVQKHLQCSAFLRVQLSHPNMTTGKTIALTRWTFVGKVMSLLCNMLSRLVITFLPRNKRFLISWLQSPSAVILEPKKIKSVLFPLSLHLFAMKWWDWMPWS